MMRLSFQRLAWLPALLLFFGSALSAQEQLLHIKTSDWGHRSDPCRVFIGVGTSSVSDGLLVDYTVEGTPARLSGVLAGDVILSLDGVPVRTQSDLVRERDKHQQGDAFTLRIRRGGSDMDIQARFKTCSQEELEASRKKIEINQMRFEELEERMAQMRSRVWEYAPAMETRERPILGVYEASQDGANGMVIKSVISGKGAEAAGLRAGDVVVTVDGKKIGGSGTLRTVLSNHKPGEQVQVQFIRNERISETTVVLSTDREFFSYKVERDPCKVFIGVYTTHSGAEGGSRVTGVIENTPAKTSGIQIGDVILALNSVPIGTHGDLTRERDKHQPGDLFTLTVLREGATIQINAQFKSCPTTPSTEPITEKVELLADGDKAEQRDAPSSTDNLLQMDRLEAYPNPTFGPLNIRFEAEAVPTTVRIFDVSGRAVYTKELPQFGGYFSEQINLFSNKPGNYVLSIQQGDQVRTKQIVLLPGA